jgi:hypothetical protein
MSEYPDFFYNPRTKTNASGVVFDADDQTRLFADDLNCLDDEVLAVETELGNNPKGDDESVVARLDRMQSEIDALK